jgi:uncharacterized protein YbjT (DUF2867 family)
MDLNPKIVTIFGGSGFVGTQIVQELARRGYRVRVAVRRPDLALHVRPLGTVGQVMPIQANVRNMASVERAVAGADMVINLVGVRFARGKQTFDAVHVKGAANVARAAAAAGAGSLVHMSALGVEGAETSKYAQSKLAGEAEVFKAFPSAVVMRPSLIFGQGDSFFNLMGTLSRYFPVMPLIGADSRFQPVYVGDVADAFVLAAEGEVRTGRVYELGGPEVLTHRELLTRILEEAGRRSKPLVALSPGIAKALALPFTILPFAPLLTADQVETLGYDNIVTDTASKEKRTLAAFGITATSMDTVLPSYMWRFRKHGQFDRQDHSPSAMA